VALYELEPERPALQQPVLVAAFDGWVDAAGAASAAVERLGEGGTVVARFDGDQLFDYRSRRPVLDVVDGVLSELAWPELTLRHVRTGARDVLVLAGAEPDLRWRELAGDLVDLVARLGVIQWISLGAVPAAVAHTRPVPVMATASRDGLLRDETRGPAGLLRVPAAALSAVEIAASRAGTPAVGFFAQVPPYVGQAYAAASLRLLEHLGRHLEVELPLEDLAATARVERRALDAAVARDSDMGEMIARLEALADESSASEARLPTADELASEIQRYLRDQAGDGPDAPRA
jgi:hypothetical protein